MIHINRMEEILVTCGFTYYAPLPYVLVQIMWELTPHLFLFLDNPIECSINRERFFPKLRKSLE